MIYLPYINPVAFELFNLKIYWYGISYLIGFICCYFAAYQLTDKKIWTTEQIADLIFYAALGIIFGGRIGYLLFYNPEIIIHAPWELFMFWEPGRSFHGGLLGVIVAIYIYSKHVNRSLFMIGDLAALMAPLGIFFGRLGNFVNSELWGKPTSMPWGMVFVNADHLPRHPSQLYESFLEGVFLFTLLWYVARTKPKTGTISGCFLILYGLLRMIAEVWREPDDHIGYIFSYLSMGQILSLPMIIAGIYIITLINKNRSKIFSGKN